jgi:CRISPR-associated protein Cas2
MNAELNNSSFSIHHSSLKQDSTLILHNFKKALFYLIVYDITCNKRRKKVSDLLEGYGARVQYSVFECVLNLNQYQQLCNRLKKRIKLDEDSIRIYPITRHTLQQVQTWGVGNDLTQAPSSMII